MTSKAERIIALWRSGCQAAARLDTTSAAEYGRRQATLRRAARWRSFLLAAAVRPSPEGRLTRGRDDATEVGGDGFGGARAARAPNAHGQEPPLPLQPVRSLRQLRRVRHRDADQLGRQVRARGNRRDHLVELARAPARPDRPRLRAHRPRRPHSVLARARRAGARARLPLHRPDRLLGAPAGHRRDRARDRALLDRATRSRCTASPASA